MFCLWWCPSAHWVEWCWVNILRTQPVPQTLPETPAPWTSTSLMSNFSLCQFKCLKVSQECQMMPNVLGLGSATKKWGRIFGSGMSSAANPWHEDCRRRLYLSILTLVCRGWVNFYLKTSFALYNRHTLLHSVQLDFKSSLLRDSTDGRTSRRAIFEADLNWLQGCSWFMLFSVNWFSTFSECLLELL